VLRETDLSQLEELTKVSAYIKTLDKTNAEIIGALSRHDPRNLSAIAKEVGLPNSTMAFRIKKLVEKLSLEVNARVDFNKLGLTRAIMFAEALPGQWDLLWNVMENMGWLTYLTKCIGVFYGCYGIFAFPAKNKHLLTQYFEEAKKLELLSEATVFWTTNLVEVHPNFKWYDFEKRKWLFHWSEWIEEIQDAKDDLPKNLADPEEYPIMADKKDLVLLRQLEKNGLISFEELSEITSLSPGGVAYRYKKHLIKRKLIVDHMVHFFPYPFQNASACAFTIQFPNQKKLAKFVTTLHNKPHVLSYAKVLGKNTLLANTYVPASEFPEFINTLGLLNRMNLVADFSYVTLTLIPHKRGGVPCEFFENGTWKYHMGSVFAKLKRIKV
jgi:DNA-binding Lrp family transcriptional regulator